MYNYYNIILYYITFVYYNSIGCYDITDSQIFVSLVLGRFYLLYKSTRITIRRYMYATKINNAV